MAEINKEQKAREMQEIAQPASKIQPANQAPVKQGMSSGAKWGIGLGVFCCCAIIILIIFLVLGFAGCTMFQFGGLRDWNYPEAPPIDGGTEIPVPSFSETVNPVR